MKNVKLTGNQGKVGGAMCVYGGKVTLENVDITGNHATSGYGAFHMNRNNSGKNLIDVTLKGKVIISGNTAGTDNHANNLHMREFEEYVDATGLTDGSKIGVTMESSRIGNGFMNITENQNGTDNSKHFESDDAAWIVGFNGEVYLKPAFEHIHCVCGKADCTDASHEKIEYAAWTSTTTLPKSGNYCLTADVTITAEAQLAKNTTLNLCLHGHKVTGKGGKGVRFFSTSGSGGEVLNITDCTATFDASGKYIAGGFYDNDNTHTNSGGGAIYIRAGGLLNFYQGIVSGNKCGTGGAAFYGKSATLNIFYAEVTDNQSYDTVNNVWKDGAALYSDNSVITVYDGVFTGNQAKSGGVYSGFGTGVLDIRGGTFTGNVAQETYGAFNAATSTLDVKLSGDVTIFGNTAAGKASNLRLGGNKADVADLADTAKISVTANPFAAFTTDTQDYTKQFESDDAKLDVVYQENKLFLIASTSEHMHCLCAGTSTKGCDHGKLPFLAWDKATSLPTGGNYYLTTDVTISTQTRLENTDLNLCLNGHTITVTTGRAFYMTDGANLTLTDCQGSGKITGATAGAILTNSAGKEMSISLYNGTFTENHAQSTGGALVVQGDCVFNMYGGKITGNTATSKLNTNADGSVKLDSAGNQSYVSANGGGVYVSADSTFNMYAGEISGNTATRIEYLKAEATKPTSAGGYAGGVAVYGKMNLYGGKIFVSSAGSELNIYGGEISGNTAQNAGGAIISQTHAVTNISGGKITKNTALKGGGGGMYVSTGTTLNMTGGEITYNVSADPEKDHNGGGLYVLASTVNMSGGVIGYNKAAGGAGMYMGLSGTRYPTLNISGTAKITGNEASGNGGAIFATGEGTKITMTGGEISKNKALNGGGLITQTKSAFEFTGGKIINNTVTASGGGIYISTNTTLKMTGGTISGNVSKGAGGGAAILRAKATITGGSVSSNTASNGAGVKIMGATVTIGGASITGNHSVGTLNKTTGKYTGANGAGIYIGRAGYKKNGVQMYDYPVVTVSGAYVAYNKADGAGAGMLVESNGTKFTMYSGTFAYNEAPNSSGGAIYFSNYSNPKVYGATIYGNKAKSAAGIYSANCTGVMENLKIYDNEGGSSTVIITGKDGMFEAKNIEIYDNVSTGAVGGIAIQGKATFNLDGAKIYGNTAKSAGGGVYFSTPGFGTWKNVEIYENEVTDGYGGGMFVGQSSIVNFDNVTIRDNKTATYGGGIACRGRLNLDNCKILNNQAGGNFGGGGICTNTMSHVEMGQNAGVYANNVIISGNKAFEQGGGVYGHRGGPIYLNSCTITDNTSGMEGGGVYANGRFGLVNCTVTGNTSGGEGFAVYFTAGEFDGHSYSTGHKKVGGNMIIKDNNGGDMYLGEGSAVAVVEGPLGEKTHMEITLHSGVLSEHLFGEYNYEGGDLNYVVTAGNRSLTDPEKYTYEAPGTEEGENAPAQIGDVLLYAGIGLVALAAIAGVILFLKKKKTPAGESK